MTVAVVETDAFKEMEKVADHMMKGLSEFQTARRLEMKVTEVRALWGHYKERLDNDTLARDAARDHLNLMVKQFDALIARAHENLEDLRTLEYDEKISAQINSSIKTISDMQAKRVDLLQKAGLLDAHDLGDELAEREEREAMILGILRDDLCPECQERVRDKLSILTGQVQGTVVEEQPVLENE